MSDIYLLALMVGCAFMTVILRYPMIMIGSCFAAITLTIQATDNLMRIAYMVLAGLFFAIAFFGVKSSMDKSE